MDDTNRQLTAGGTSTWDRTEDLAVNRHALTARSSVRSRTGRHAAQRAWLSAVLVQQRVRVLQARHLRDVLLKRTENRRQTIKAARLLLKMRVAWHTARGVTHMAMSHARRTDAARVLQQYASHLSPHGTPPATWDPMPYAL